MKRVLFVDDEVLILESLQSLLRKQRQKWEMVFVTSGEEALRRMETDTFDVVVTDMRMPKMDGAELLRQVKLTHPGAVRVILSGYSEVEAALRTVPIAHQFLCKPCEATTLVGVVERTCNLHALLHDPQIREAVGSVGHLPSAPRVYLAITRALEDPKTSIKDVAKLVEQDPAISAKVLQMVNSAFFALPRRVTAVRQAVGYLGANMLKRVLLSVEAFDTVGDQFPKDILSLDGLQQHSLVVSRLSAMMMEGDTQKAQDAFVAGMLHDLGQLVLALKQPKKLREAVRATADSGQPLYSSETSLYGTSHAEVGAYLLGLWGLPYTVVEAVAHHHLPARVEHETFDVLDAVHVADVLAAEFAPECAVSSTGSIEPQYAHSLGIDQKLEQWRASALNMYSSRR